MKTVLFLAALISFTVSAKDIVDQKVLNIQKSGINQYILVIGLEGAFRLPGVKEPTVGDLQKCVLIGTAHSAFLTLRALNFSDADISELIKLAEPAQIKALESKVAEEATMCGSLF